MTGAVGLWRTASGCIAVLAAVAMSMPAGRVQAQVAGASNWPRPENGKPLIAAPLLLRQAPFFAGLDDASLRWVAEHARGWQVAAGEEISNSNQDADSFWVLLDGGWEIESGARRLGSGPAEAAKWYGGAEFRSLERPSRLVATVPGHVVNLRWADLETLRHQAPSIEAHLLMGLTRYRAFLD